MSRCDCGLHLVAWVTLLAIGVCFVVILTDVFVDIDRLIGARISTAQPKQASARTEPRYRPTPDPRPPEKFNNDEGTLDENDDAFRTKRSLEAQTRHHPKSAKITKLLSQRLASLLEEMDSEYTTSTPHRHSAPRGKESGPDAAHKSDLLRLTVHNILLDGVVNHVDFSDIYKEITAFQQAFKQMYPEKEWTLQVPTTVDTSSNSIASTPGPKVLLFKKDLYGKDNENKILYDELLKCAELKADIQERMKTIPDHTDVYKEDSENFVPSMPPWIPKKEPKFVIKTDIDIKTADDKNNTLTKDDFAAVIHVSYNGKPVHIHNATPSFATADKYYNKDHLNLTFVHDFLKKYFHLFSLTQHDEPSYPGISKIETKRLKRHIKLRFTDQNDSDKEDNDTYDNTIVKRTGSADDELFVEIKTYFNNNTVKGDKKRKLIETLIEKIENAVHSDLPLNDHKQRKKVALKHWNIKKRLQNPLKQYRFRTKSVPLHITARQIKAIDKVEEKHQSHEIVVTKEPDNDYYRVKVDEANQLDFSDVKYNENDKYKNVAQRLQVPMNINRDISNETLNDLHKLKFLIKNIDGSGFSIGFNQYSDEPPDPESIKLFTGLDHLIRTYHQQYDQIDEEKDVNYGSYENYYDQNHVITKRSLDVSTSDKFAPDFPDFRKEHISPSDVDDIFRIVKLFPDNPMNNIIEISHTTDVVTPDQIIVLKTTNETQKANKDISQTDKRPVKFADIFNVANSFDRTKRSPKGKNSTLKEIILRERIKHAKRRKIMKKRQVAIGHPSGNQDYLEEFISKADDHARRAIIENLNKHEATGYFRRETNAFNPPFEGRSSLLPPILYQQNPTFVNYRRTVSKPVPYPHVFEDTKVQTEQEEDAEYFPVDRDFKIDMIKDFTKKDIVEAENSDLPNFKDIVGSLSDKKYKITVKVLPKQFNRDETTNETETLAGFKEVHTTINKSFDKNGKRISTSLNISQVSHIVDLHNTSANNYTKPNIAKPLLVDNRVLVKQQKIPTQDSVNNIFTEHKKTDNNKLVHFETEKGKTDDLLNSENAKLIRRPKDTPNNIKLLANATSTVDRTRKFGAKVDELLEITLPFQPHKVLRLTKEQIGNILVSSMKVQDKVKTAYLDHIINDNLSLTHDILRKIDRNTDMLEKLLQKLTSDKRISTILKRASIDSAEVMITDVVKLGRKAPEEPLRVQMLPVEKKANQAPTTKTIVKEIHLENEVGTEKPLENTATFRTLNKSKGEETVKYVSKVKTINVLLFNSTEPSPILTHL